MQLTKIMPNQALFMEEKQERKKKKHPMQLTVPCENTHDINWLSSTFFLCSVY